MIESSDALRSLYPDPKPRALQKQLDHLDEHCARFIGLSPFVIVASGDATGRLDASPRGGTPGFVHVLDQHTLLLPDATGNNRLDTLTNITSTGRVGLLFLIPGMDETLRVNGTARLGTESELLRHFAGASRAPTLVMAVTVEEAYLHCAKALMRAKLWSAESRIDRGRLPTYGQMINDQIGCTDPPETQEAMLARYAPEL